MSTKTERVHIVGRHYTEKSIQPWDAMESWMDREQFIGFLRGNVIKYLARCDDKGGWEDLQKARHYLDKLIEFQCQEQDESQSSTKDDRTVRIKRLADNRAKSTG